MGFISKVELKRQLIKSGVVAANTDQISRQITLTQKNAVDALVKCQTFLKKASDLINEGEEKSDNQYGFFDENAKEIHDKLCAKVNDAIAYLKTQGIEV